MGENANGHTENTAGNEVIKRDASLAVFRDPYSHRP